MTGEDPTLTVAEFVEYCETQARLLAGRVETLREEVDEVLDDVDESIADLQSRLDDQSDDVARTASPQSTPRPDSADIDTLVELEEDIETKQERVAATQARLTTMQELAAGYADLGDALRTEVDDGREALERVIRFEVDHDAEAYFDEKLTVTEAARQSGSDTS